ncbi:TrmH family RNA methyltransferase [Spirochaetia bacterium 38H-sp]|uniref:TrmH family RNA methyltransferase n=1 Tax=Rarispira pelagica TaxID=3141764 RepID=A0ABU9U8T3_9SPIR
MITPGKFASLSSSAKKRKLLRLCKQWLYLSESDWVIYSSVVRSILDISSSVKDWDDNLRAIILDTLVVLRQASPSDRAYKRAIMNLASSVGEELGIYTADWDSFFVEKEICAGKERTVLPITLYLEDVRSPYNVGSIFRTAEALGGERIFLGGITPSLDNNRARKTARGSEHIIKWQRSELKMLVSYYTVFALETGGTPVDDFVFPERGLMIVGSEELGVSQEALELAEKKGAGRVSVPLLGLKGSLNVSVATGIVLYFWKKSLLSS